MEKQGRIAGLDLCKVLALYFVVLYHLTFRNSPDVFSGRIPELLEYALGTLMSCCVPLLFLVSGALSMDRPVNLKRNLRRCGQVLFLTVFWMLASLVTVLLLRGERVSGRTFFEIVTSLKVGYIQHLWYMPAFLFLCLITPVMQALRQQSRRVWLYGLGLLLVFTFGNLLLNDLEYVARWLTGRLGCTGTRQYFWYTNFFVYHYWYALVYYGAGALLLEYREVFGKHRGACILAIPVCGAFLTVTALARCHSYGYVFDPVFNNYGSVFTLILTVSVAGLLLNLRPGAKISRWAKSLSDCSLGVYLIHWLLIEALMDYLPALTSQNTFAPLVAVAVLGVSWALTWCLCKIPVVKNLFTVTPGWVKK